MGQFVFLAFIIFIFVEIKWLFSKNEKNL